MKQQTITLNKSQGENSTTQEIKLIYPGLTSKILQILQQNIPTKSLSNLLGEHTNQKFTTYQ